MNPLRIILDKYADRLLSRISAPDQNVHKRYLQIAPAELLPAGSEIVHNTRSGMPLNGVVDCAAKDAVAQPRARTEGRHI